MRDGDANHEQVQRWLSALRDGTEAEKIAARRGLARVFERRGMLEEAVDLLEANVRAEVRSGEIFRWFDTDVDASHAGALSRRPYCARHRGRDCPLAWGPAPLAIGRAGAA